jgi:predicted DNA-binding antitoxin AbrB/MazE fold protein
MSHVDAVYRIGVFRPLGPVDLKDEQRVRLSFETTPQQPPQQWHERAKRMQAALRSRGADWPDSTADIAADRVR